MPDRDDTQFRGESECSRPICLSARQQQVLMCAAHGLNQAQTARQLGLATVTVEHHLARARRRLGACSTAQAVAIAVMTGLVGMEVGDG